MGIDADPINDTELFLEACSQANPRYQGGKDLVRFQLEQDETTWPEEVQDATMILAGHLGMLRDSTPLSGKYDMIIALGGARRSPLHRACYAAQAVVDKRASVSYILAIAGSTRPLGETEKAQVQDFAEGAETEFDLCSGAAEVIRARYPDLHAEAVCNPDPKSGNDGVIDRSIEMLRLAAGQKTLRVAAVTTQIYVQGLYLDMARAAKRHGLHSSTAAGHSSDPEMVFNRTVSTYLSECLTTLRKAAIAAREGC
jgi:hypothetical protein